MNRQSCLAALGALIMLLGLSPAVAQERGRGGEPRDFERRETETKRREPVTHAESVGKAREAAASAQADAAKVNNAKEASDARMRQQAREAARNLPAQAGRSAESGSLSSPATPNAKPTSGSGGRGRGRGPGSGG